MVTGPPEATPVTVPLLFTLAIEGSLLVHAPPGVALVKVAELPVQIFDTPEIFPTVGAGSIVILKGADTVLPHTLEAVYVRMAVPAETPETTPELLPMVATPVEEELHVPPASASLKVVVAPTHTVNVPVIAATPVFTVTSTLAVHSVPAIE